MSKLNSIDLARNVRKHVVQMVVSGSSSHVASALSCVDLLSVLYSDVLSVNSKNYTDPNRDRFILSKGHAGAAVYAVLAELDFFPVSNLDSHCQNGSFLSGHVSSKNVPGVELSTGSLGHGLPVAVGMALAAKIDGRQTKVFTLLGDGELMEGSNWEAILFAAHHHLDNLTVIIDRNGLQSIYSTEDTIALDPITEKFDSFNWASVDVDGHDHQSIRNALKNCENSKPKVVVANTIKGFGVSFMENRVEWHYKYPDANQLAIALEEIEKR